MQDFLDGIPERVKEFWVPPSPRQGCGYPYGVSPYTGRLF